mgnify:CR=1 FL=1
MANDEETVIPGMYWGDSVFIDVIDVVIDIRDDGHLVLQAVVVNI